MAELVDNRQAELERAVGILVSAFQPENIYLFGSFARGTPSEHSDLDLLVVVKDAGEYPHRLAQEAMRVIGPHRTPMDIMFLGRDEFDRRAKVVSSLPATVLREGRLLHAS
jgi:predicted nucleotidyltransferase